jgi:uncharacterized protein (DUF1501 family)
MSFWDHIGNPAVITNAQLVASDARRIELAMSALADTTPMFAPYQRTDYKTVYRPEPIKRVTPQRPLNLDDTFIDAHPHMAAALTTAHRLRLDFEWID